MLCGAAEGGAVVRGCVVVPGASVPGVLEFPGVDVPESGVAVTGVGVTASGVAVVDPEGLVFISGLFEVGALFPGVAVEPGVVAPVFPEVEVPVAEPAVPVWLDGEPAVDPPAPAVPAEPAAVPCMSGVMRTASSTFSFSVALGPLPEALQLSATLVALLTWKLLLPAAIPFDGVDTDPLADDPVADDPLAEEVLDIDPFAPSILFASPAPLWPVTWTLLPTRVRSASKFPVS